MADKKISALPAATTPLAGTEVLPVVQGGVTDQVSVANLTAGRAVSALSVSTTQDVTTGRNIVVTGAGTIEQNGAAGGLYFHNTAVSGGATNQRFYTTNASGAAQLQLGLYGGATPTNDIYGNLSAVTGNFVVGTAGKGIDFSANGGDVLTQYDEGTWTPVLRFGGASTGITYTTQAGTYTRIGRTVTVRFEILLSSKGSATGEADITGLPFAASNLNSMAVYLYSGFLATYKSGIAYCNGTTINELATYGLGPFTDIQFTNTSRFWATCTYQI